MVVVMDDRERRIADLEAGNAEPRKRLARVAQRLQNILQRRKKTRSGAADPERRESSWR